MVGKSTKSKGILSYKNNKKKRSKSKLKSKRRTPIKKKGNKNNTLKRNKKTLKKHSKGLSGGGTRSQKKKKSRAAKQRDFRKKKRREAELEDEELEEELEDEELEDELEDEVAGEDEGEESRYSFGLDLPEGLLDYPDDLETQEENERAYEDKKPLSKSWKKLKSAVPNIASKYREGLDILQRVPSSSSDDYDDEQSTYQNSTLVKNIYDGLMYLNALSDNDNLDEIADDFIKHINDPKKADIDKIITIINYVEEYNQELESEDIFILEDVDLLKEKLFQEIMSLYDYHFPDNSNDFYNFIKDQEVSIEDKFYKIMDVKDEILIKMDKRRDEVNLENISIDIQSDETDDDDDDDDLLEEKAKGRWSKIGQNLPGLVEKSQLEEEVPRTGQTIDEPGYEKQREEKASQESKKIARGRWSDAISSHVQAINIEKDKEEGRERARKRQREQEIEREKIREAKQFQDEGYETDETGYGSDETIGYETDERELETFPQPFGLTARPTDIQSLEPSGQSTPKPSSSNFPGKVKSGFKKLKSILSGPEYEQLLKNNGEQLKSLYIQYLDEYFNDISKGEDIDTIKTKYISFIDKYYNEALQNDKLLLEKLKNA
jgi:hypothetical protein